MRRLVLILALSALFLAPPAALPASEAPKPANPNIAIILTDDLGYGDIGVHGCKDIPTPHIDKLAAGGVRFTNAYAAGAAQKLLAVWRLAGIDSL